MINFRIRQFLAILIAALLTAAALRHLAHVHGGMTREEIRTDALIAAAVVAGLLAIAVLRSRRQP